MYKIEERNLRKKIQSQIRYYILDSGLRAGDSIPTEKQLSEILGSSRTAIREALKGLEAVGVIEVHHGVGRFIREFDFEPILENLPFCLETNNKNYQEILELRVCLESHFIMKNLPRYTEEDIEKMKLSLSKINQVLSDNSGKIALVDAHSAFHCSLMQITENSLLINFTKIFASIHMSITVLHKSAKDRQVLFIEYHNRIIGAIRKKDPVLLEQCLVNHFSDPYFERSEL